MKVKWLIQDVGIAMANIASNFEALKALDLSYANFGLIDSERRITNLENILSDPDEVFIIRGGTKILSLLQSISSLGEVNSFLSEEQIRHSQQYIKQLKDGVFYDEERFDQAYYGQLNLPLLNDDACYLPIKDILTQTFSTDMFVKPSKDQKAFNAGVLQVGQTIKDFVEHQYYQKRYIEEMAVIASCKTTIAEYRFFVVDKEVITGSRYHFAGKVSIHENVPHDVLMVAKEYAKLYQPHDVFTMDLAETPSGIKIVEYNCWNASGLYKTDVKKIFDAVHQYKMQQKAKPVRKAKFSLS